MVFSDVGELFMVVDEDEGKEMMNKRKKMKFTFNGLPDLI